LVISAVNADLGEAVEEVACEYDGPDFRLGINPDYLSQFLAAVDTDRVRLELKDENTQCVGYPQDPRTTEPADAAGADGSAEIPAGAPASSDAPDAPVSDAAPGAANGRYLCVIMPMRI
jgi:DNA polymerase III sliding clamp (beta) subunit (PCNA family)